MPLFKHERIFHLGQFPVCLCINVLNGGLMLEDELEQKSDMEKTEIKKIQRMAQKLLEQLQDPDCGYSQTPANDVSSYHLRQDQDNAR